MFLGIICYIKHIIMYVLNFIETHSVLVGIVTAVITGSLWFRKYLREKRVEAFCGFYAQLSMQLYALTERLNHKSQLNISDFESGNIFSLIYIKKCIKEFCPKYSEPNQEEKEIYGNLAKQIKDLLLKTSNNVYPPGANKNQWYNSQRTLFLFCDFITNKEYWYTTNIQCDENEKTPKHIVKCQDLLNAVTYIQKAIESANY